MGEPSDTKRRAADSSSSFPRWTPVPGIAWKDFSGGGADEWSPDIVYGFQIGSERFDQIQSLALDSQYLYVLDAVGTLDVWPGLPEVGEAPLFSFQSQVDDGSIYSDGNHLSISSQKFFGVIAVAELDSTATFTEIPDPPNLSTAATQGLVSQGRVFRADQGYNRVYAWRRLEDALAGGQPDALLGATNWNDTDPDTTQDGLFWPTQLDFDGERLWVGEFKFSGRVVAFRIP